MATNQPKVVVVFSGGLDSTTCVYDAIDQGYSPDLVSFNYGQRHKKELEYAARTAARLGLRHDIVDLSGLTPLLAESGSSLVSDTEVPEGHYAEDNMVKTIVPNRNMMMISIAGSIAVSRKAEYVITGVHAGDHAVYPDCRPIFIEAAAEALVYGNEGFGMNGLMAPYIKSSKAEIARRAILLKVPFEDTWSCYKGGDLHCGRCGTCVERLEAISEAISMLWKEGNPLVQDSDGAEGAGKMYDQIDQTKYVDRKYWVEAVAEAKRQENM